MYKSGEKFRRGDGCDECECLPSGKTHCLNRPCYPGGLLHNLDIFFFQIFKIILIQRMFFFGGGISTVKLTCFENQFCGIPTFSKVMMQWKIWVYNCFSKLNNYLNNYASCSI